MNDSVRLRTTNFQTRDLKELDTRKERESERIDTGITEVRRGGEAQKAVLVCGAVRCLVVHRNL